MKLVLTGANGFIGSYFVRKYSEKYIIQKFSFLHEDFEELSLNDTDVVIHLSALVHQMNGASPTEYEQVNVTQTKKLAQKAKLSGVRQFIFMSTVKVYGEESQKIYTEESLCFPEDEYGKSKLKAEKELQKLQDENFRIAVIRTPIVYGYGVKANIKSLINLVSKVPVLPLGGITNRRSMVYIGNLCHLIDEVMYQNSSGVFLASDNFAISTSMLIKGIAKNLNKKIILLKFPFFGRILKALKPAFYKKLFGDLQIDNTLTQKKLQLKNPYSLEEGIAFMIHGEND